MSHPTRANALRLLIERGEMSPKEIAAEIGETISNVSYHCRRLVKLDCAECVREERVPGKGAVQHFYIATDRHLLTDEDWGAMDPIVGRGILEDITDKIFDDYSTSISKGILGGDEKFHLTRTPLVLDEEGIGEALRNSERWRLEQSEIERRSAERRSETDAPGISVSSSLAFFKMPRE